MSISMMGPDVSIVLMAHAETASLESAIPRLLPLVDEVIVAENGSDVAGEICERLGARRVVSKDKGIGVAQDIGIRAARNEKVIVLGSDLPIDLAFIEDCRAALGRWDAVYASKMLPSSVVDRPWLRNAWTAVWSDLCAASGSKILDVGSAGKGFLKPKILPVLDELEPMSALYDLHMAKAMAKHRLRVLEVPCRVSDHRKTSFSVLRSMLRTPP